MRITNSQMYRTLLSRVSQHREELDKYGNEVTSGVKASSPGDSRQSGTIARFQQLLSRIEGHQSRLSPSKALLDYQDGILTQASDQIVRAQEIAEQAANESNSPEQRAELAAEVWEIRDHLVTLANSTYQGRYVYGCADDDDPPYDKAAPYAEPASGQAADRYVFDAEDGTSQTRSVQITDDLALSITTPANKVFDNTIQALERLGRSLSGYKTNPAAGAPDGTGAAYTFPTEFQQQSEDIKKSLDLLTSARKEDVMTEQVSVAGRLRRIETAESVLKLTKDAAKEALANLQEADVVDSATALTQAQTALEASLQITAKVLSNSLMDYI